MSNYVPGTGNALAKLVIVGEAPGAQEVSSGIPFSGPSGDLLNQALCYAGIDRSETYLTNVCKVRPPNNDLTKLNTIGHSIEEFLPQLWDEINSINPNCILAVGGTALEHLTGYKGIRHYRGSILRCLKSPHKVVATMHPAGLLHTSGVGEVLSWKELAYIKADVKRAVEQSAFPDIRSIQRNLHIARNSMDVYRFLNKCKPNPFLDVETFKTFPLCLALSCDPQEAISIPLFLEEIPPHELAQMWKMLAEFLAQNDIGAQNAKFDQKRCRQIGLHWRSCFFSMEMGWHILFPEFPKKLEFISSMITEEPYYKDEGKEYNPKAHSVDRLFMYNAKDAAVEKECSDVIIQELKDSNLYEFFFDKIMPLYQLYYDIEDVGILVDKDVRKKLQVRYRDLWREKQDLLIKNISDNDPIIYEMYKNFNVMSNGPKNQVAKLVYGYLKCPLRKDTSDETLKSLANNVVKSQRVKDILLGILQVRKIRKTIGTYLEAKLSNNEYFFYPPSKDRIHTTCNINGTESGRTSTGILKPPVAYEKMGIALQTMTKHEDIQLSSAGGSDLRSMFIADPGFTIVEPDLAQAEDRVVRVLAKDWDGLKEYQKKNFKFNKYGIKDDTHTITAMQVCSLDFDSITDYERQIGKKTRHAGNYNMKKHMHMLNLAKFGGIYISEWAAGKQLEKFHASNSKIRSVYHEEIVEALRDNNCTLFSPHGRRRIFFNNWGEELFKEAYANIPQATVSDQTKFAMVEAKRRMPEIQFFLESHDSCPYLIPDKLLEKSMIIMKEELEKPINFRNCSLSRDYDLIIPAEFKIGKRWVDKSELFPDGMEKFKI